MRLTKGLRVRGWGTKRAQKGFQLAVADIRAIGTGDLVPGLAAWLSGLAAGSGRTGSMQFGVAVDVHQADGRTLNREATASLSPNRGGRSPQCQITIPKGTALFNWCSNMDGTDVTDAEFVAGSAGAQILAWLPGARALVPRDMLPTEQTKLEATGYHAPDGAEEAVQRVVREIAQRRGGKQFRESLLNAYERRCAITGCECEEALEAAHIRAYSQSGTNLPTNGLLLRADIHTLFDLGCISIDPDTMTVVVSPDLQQTEYQALQGEHVAVPEDTTLRPDAEALAEHRASARS